MMAHLWQIGAAAAILVLLLPYAMRFDLKVLARLSLRGAKGWFGLWPVATWIRALGKPPRERGSFAWLGALLGTLILLSASVVAVCSGTLAGVWLVALLVAGRTMLACAACHEPRRAAVRYEGLMEAWLSGATFALALVGPASLAAQMERAAAGGVGRMLLQQPLAFTVLLVALAGIWADGVGDREGPTTALTFHCLHAGRANACLVTGSYALRVCGLAVVGAIFLPSAAWSTRLSLIVVSLPVLLWLRGAYVVGLRKRLGWRFWPLLATLGSVGGVLTLWVMAG